MRELVVHALLCCDRIVTENNGKKGLIGVFQSFQFPRLPAANLPWFLYAALGNMAAGAHGFTVNITHDESSGVVFSQTGEMNIKRERDDVELVLPVVCRFQKYGAHVITLHVGGDVVASRILRIVQRGGVEPTGTRDNGEN